MSFISEKFLSFISPECNRTEFLKQWLTDSNIPFTLIKLEGKTHFYIQFPKSAYSPKFRIKTLIAHYDRVKNVSGANDNSASVYELICLAEKLLKTQRIHNTRIIFTDGEEVTEASECESFSAASSVATAQGAYALAQHFRKAGLLNDDVFVFDGCGRGNTLVVSTAGKTNLGSRFFQQRMEELYNKMCRFAVKCSPENWITAPVPYSDNAGFIASGVPAVAVTVLPSEEATAYIQYLHKEKKLAENVMCRTVGSKSEDAADHLLQQEKLPKTWRIMHTQFDNASTLTEDAFSLMGRLLETIAFSVEPL